MSLKLQQTFKFAVFLICANIFLFTTPVYSQDVVDSQTPGTDSESAWQAPDITALPADWWQLFEFSSPEIFQRRIAGFMDGAAEAIANLEGENLIIAQNTLRTLRSQVDLISVAVGPPSGEDYERILISDEYTLDEVLTLQAQGRVLKERQKVPGIRIDQLEREALLPQQKMGPLLRQYEAADGSSPGRVLLGLNRVVARVEYELAIAQQKSLAQTLLALEEQSGLVNEQFEFARTHLTRGDIKIADVDSEVDKARTRISANSERIAAIQLQLRNILTSENGKPSLELLRKQQLIRASVERTLATMQAVLHEARANWYRYRSDILPLNFDLPQEQTTTKNLIVATDKQVEIWTAASETTLITPVRSTDLNTVKNFELAHAAARETLALIEQIRASSDDLSLVQEILSSQIVEEQKGFGASWTRLQLIVSSTLNQFGRFMDFDLFHVGEQLVTPGGILKMFLILTLGFVLSWFLRHLLDRVQRNKKYAKSPAIYTLGRLMHYIIIVAALFAALASLGLDFTNFALIAGALSVGIGFGLQSIVNNLVSGLVLLFEGSLRVGDYIELNTGVAGVVKEINTRATVINTNDSVDVVVPNSDFVNNQLTNWTLREPIARVRLGFGVAYGSDKELVKKAALEAAHDTEFVLHNMPSREPEVRLVNFGDSSLDFQLLAWVSRAGVRRPQKVNALFLWNLETRLAEYGIEIPFPQRDVHIIPPAKPAVTEEADPETS